MYYINIFSVMFYNYVNMYFISYNYKKKLYKNSITWICCHFNDDKNINFK